MKAITLTSVAILTALLRISAPSATAAVTVIEHVGSANPTTEGWTVNPASLDTHFGGTEVTASGNHDFWQINHVDLTTPFGTATYTPSAQQLNSDWTFEASVRVVDSPAVGGVPYITIGVIDGRQWAFNLGNDLVGLLSNVDPGSLSASANVDTRLDYHTYQISFHRNGSGTADDTADFYYDGTLLFGGIGRPQLRIIQGSLVLWGPRGTADSANYEYVAFVPEPGNLIVFGILFGCACAHRNHSRLD